MVRSKYFTIVKYYSATVKYHFRFIFSYKSIILILNLSILNILSKHTFSFQTIQNILSKITISNEIVKIATNWTSKHPQINTLNTSQL